MEKSRNEIEKLIEELKGSNYRQAERSLIKIGRAAIEPLIRALRNENSKIRQHSTAILGEICDTMAVKPLIISLLEDENEWVRSSAALSLGMIGDKQTVEPLMKALKDSHDNVRYSAIDALGMLKNHRAVEELIHVLNHDKSWYARSHAANALGEIGDDRAVGSLVNALKDKDTVSPAASALSKIRDKRAIAPLIDALKNTNPDEEYMAFQLVQYALEGFGEYAAEPLIPLIENGESKVREGVIAILSKIGDKRVAELLIKLLQDKNEATEIKLAARGALKEIKRRGVKISAPRKGIDEYFEQFKSFLKIYFTVPSSEGFGPYRTGGGLHLLCSAFTGGMLWVIFNGLHWHYLYSAGLIFVAVLFLWGIGTWLGISSHYNPIIWLLILFVFGIMISIIQRVSWLSFSYWMMLWGGTIGYFAHVFWSIILPKQS